MQFFDKDRAKQQLEKVYEQGLLQSDPYWNFGYPILTECLADLKRGLWFLIAPENVGKSMFQLNLGYQVLQHNEGAYWLDVSLDDGVEDRIAYLLARTGDMPISLVRRAGAAPDEEKHHRKHAFNTFIKAYGGRYHLIGLSEDSVDEDDSLNYFQVNWICSQIATARAQLGDEAKLFVTVDGFHDVQGSGEEETTQQKRKSQTLKKCASEANALIVLSAHTRKDSRKRQMTADIMKGEDTPAYDGKVITHLYSDVNLNREMADLYWVDEDQPDRRLPVHELDILKNKGGSEKKVIYYNYLPERCWDYEVDEDFQALYRETVFKGSQKKKE